MSPVSRFRRPFPDPVHGGVYTPFGDAGANTFIGPGIVDLDLSAFKSFLFTETKRLEFRSEWFNSLNHPNFMNPSAALGTGTIGEIPGAGPSRQIQMALKFIFQVRAQYGSGNPLLQ